MNKIYEVFEMATYYDNDFDLTENYLFKYLGNAEKKKNELNTKVINWLQKEDYANLIEKYGTLEKIVELLNKGKINEEMLNIALIETYWGIREIILDD